MKLTLRSWQARDLPAGTYATAPDGHLYVRAESHSNAGVWMRYATDAEKEAWAAKGWDTTFDCLRPAGAGGGWMRLREILTPATADFCPPPQSTKTAGRNDE